MRVLAVLSPQLLHHLFIAGGSGQPADAPSTPLTAIDLTMEGQS